MFGARFLPLLAAALMLASSAAEASTSHNNEWVGDIRLPKRSRHPLSEHRRNEMIDQYHRQQKRSLSGSKKTCKAKTQKAQDNKTKASSVKQNQSDKQGSWSASSAATGTQHKAKVSASASSSSSSSSKESDKGTAAKANVQQKTKSDSKSNGDVVDGVINAVGKGLFGMTFAACGSADATEELPNGQQWFLNCGIDDGGWNPPDVKLSDLKVQDAETAVNGAFSECKDYVWAFKQAGKTHGIPPTILMSFAMQESTCNPSVTGGNGEQGMMQITQDKCGGAPGGNCKDVSFNVNKGAEYFKQMLDQSNGNVPLAVGSYNGWSKGLTVAKATAAKKQGNCYAQNNLDYIFQMFNGWFLGKNAYSMGKYQNLAGC